MVQVSVARMNGNDMEDEDEVASCCFIFAIELRTPAKGDASIAMLAAEAINPSKYAFNHFMCMQSIIIKIAIEIIIDFFSANTRSYIIKISILVRGMDGGINTFSVAQK